MEKRLLQAAILIGAAAAALTGLEGVVRGPALAGASSIELGADSQFRFLSGLLAGLGAAYAMLVPAIEREGPRLFMLTSMVVFAGFCRGAGMLISGPEGLSPYVAIAVALIGAPALWLWQGRIARIASVDEKAPAA